MARTSDLAGNLTFSEEVEKEVTFSEPLSGADYRVLVSSEVFSLLVVTDKSTAGFKVQAAAEISGSVGWDLFL